jgi:hypothetical protein
LDQHDEADVVNSTIKTLICPAFIMYINKKVKHYREKESEFIIYISLLFIKLKKKKKSCLSSLNVSKPLLAIYLTDN